MYKYISQRLVQKKWQKYFLYVKQYNIFKVLLKQTMDLKTIR